MNQQIVPGVIRFDGYRLVSLSYCCDANFSFESIKDGKMRLNFQKKTVRCEDEREIQLHLKTNVFFSDSENYDDAQYRITVELAGFFFSEREFDLKWETNALAILFPYARAIVSSITSQSGRKPVILPTANIAQMFKESEEAEIK